MQDYKFVIKYVDGTHKIDCCVLPSTPNLDWVAAWKRMLEKLESDKKLENIKSVMAIRNSCY